MYLGRASTNLFAVCLLSAVVVFFSPAGIPAHAQTQTTFIEDLGDVPLMPGLQLDESEGVIFDAAEGRIVESVAYGAVPGNRVRAFYDEALPELGWRLTGDGFLRETETLRLDIREAKGTTTVRFFLSPKK